METPSPRPRADGELVWCPVQCSVIGIYEKKKEACFRDRICQGLVNLGTAFSVATDSEHDLG